MGEKANVLNSSSWLLSTSVSSKQTGEESFCS